jgi:hypothetical protein
VCHGIPHRLPRCDASITIAGLLVVIGPVAWLGLGLIDGLEMLLARLRSGKLVPPPSQAIKDWPFIGQQLYDFWLLASTNARSAAAATAARWAILAEYGEQRRHLDAEFSRLRNHRGLFVFSWAAARHNGKDPRTETRLEARQRVCGNCRGDDSHGIAGRDRRFPLTIGCRRNRNGIRRCSGRKPFGTCDLGSRHRSDRLADYCSSAHCVELAHIDDGDRLAFTACMSIVIVMENFLKPFVLTRGLTTPMLVTLIGVVGGVFAYGLAGLFVGPVVLAVAWDLAKAWIHDSTLPAS